MTTNTHLVTQVRQAIDTARQQGRPTPGRPTLVRLTGATDHAIKKALAELANQHNNARNQPGARLVITSQPDDTNPPAQHQAGHHPVDHDTRPAPAITTASHNRQPRPWPLVLIGLAAAVAVWGGWVDLGRRTGFGIVQPLPGLFDELHINTAIALPIGMDVYAAFAIRTWLSTTQLSTRTTTFARWSAITSLLLGAGAQAASHLMHATHTTTAPPLVTILVACVPVLALGLATTLATLVKRDTGTRQQP